MAQADYFLKIDGIEGGSRDDKHRGEIDLQSFSWGMTTPALAGGGGGGGAGKVSVQDFHFVTQTGIQSPPLMLASATGQHFKKATLTVRKSGDKEATFLKQSLTDVVVSSYQIGGTEGGDGGLPCDQVSLRFSKVELQVTQQNPDGSPGKPVSAGWDVTKNTKI